NREWNRYPSVTQYDSLPRGQPRYLIAMRLAYMGPNHPAALIGPDLRRIVDFRGRHSTYKWALAHERENELPSRQDRTPTREYQHATAHRISTGRGIRRGPDGRRPDRSDVRSPND